MYGEGWIFKGGKGGLSGGGGSNGEWVWGDTTTPGEDYTYECEDTLPFLGMIYDKVLDGDEYTFKVLMKKNTTPDVGNFKTSGSPAALDFNRTGGGSSEEVEHTELPVPEACFESGELKSFSSYTSTTQWRSIEFSFDGATYYVPYNCWPGYDAVVRDLRGDTYINNLILGQNYPGTSKLWQFYYQSNLIEESDFPGVQSPFSSGGMGKILSGQGGIGQGKYFIANRLINIRWR